jgi:hypothetical protein
MWKYSSPDDAAAMRTRQLRNPPGGGTKFCNWRSLIFYSPDWEISQLRGMAGFRRMTVVVATAGLHRNITAFGDFHNCRKETQRARWPRYQYCTGNLSE